MTEAGGFERTTPHLPAESLCQPSPGRIQPPTVTEVHVLVVQCDFDDTITVGNVSMYIREAFGPSEWMAFEEEYASGKYSVEESNIRQFAHTRATKRDIEDLVARRVVFRHGFKEFAEHCLETETRLAVVSSGLDLYIDPALKQLGLEHLEVHSGKARVSADGIKVEYTDPSGRAITRGFKESYVRHFKKKGYTVIYLGDGISDIAPAAEADFVIARSTLEEHLRSNHLRHYSLEGFDDVGDHVEEVRRQISNRRS